MAAWAAEGGRVVPMPGASAVLAAVAALGRRRPALGVRGVPAAVRARAARAAGPDRRRRAGQRPVRGAGAGGGDAARPRGGVRRRARPAAVCRELTKLHEKIVARDPRRAGRAAAGDGDDPGPRRVRRSSSAWPARRRGGAQGGRAPSALDGRPCRGRAARRGGRRARRGRPAGRRDERGIPRRRLYGAPSTSDMTAPARTTSGGDAAEPRRQPSDPGPRTAVAGRADRACSRRSPSRSWRSSSTSCSTSRARAVRRVRRGDPRARLGRGSRHGAARGDHRAAGRRHPQRDVRQHRRADHRVLRAPGRPDHVVKASITGSIIGNLLLVLGAGVLVGGLRNGIQTFSQQIAGSNAALLVLAAGRAVRARGVRAHDRAIQPAAR